MTIIITELGLASYIKIKGNKLIRFEKGFIFETDKTENEWRVEYLHSESYAHDSELLQLRKFLK